MKTKRYLHYYNPSSRILQHVSVNVCPFQMVPTIKFNDYNTHKKKSARYLSKPRVLEADMSRRILYSSSTKPKWNCVVTLGYPSLCIIGWFERKYADVYLLRSCVHLRCASQFNRITLVPLLENLAHNVVSIYLKGRIGVSWSAKDYAERRTMVSSIIAETQLLSF